MKIKGAIFDVDGTILDSMLIWDTIGEEYLLSRNITPRENLNERFKSMSLLQAAQYYKEEYGLKESTEEIIKNVNSMIEHLYANQVTLKKGIYDFVLKLFNQGVKLCIATATDYHLVEAALKRNNMHEFFSDIFTCGNVGFGKDNSAIYDTALNHLGTKKEETVVFEDALYAIKTAKNAGYRVIAVYDEYERKNWEKIKEEADEYICSFEEMGNFFD